MKNIRDRLRELRIEKKYDQRQLAEILNVTAATVSRWENGDRAPSIDMLYKIATALNTSVAYLVGGIDDPAPFITAGSELNGQTGQDLTPAQISSRLTANAHRSDYIEIPVLTMATAACCGAGNGLYGVEPESTRTIPVLRRSIGSFDETRRPFAIMAEGDSMTGAGILDGATVVVNPAEEVHTGNAALVAYDNKWMIKWVIFKPDHSIELQSANPAYNTQTIDKEYADNAEWFRIIGKVTRIISEAVPREAF